MHRTMTDCSSLNGGSTSSSSDVISLSNRGICSAGISSSANGIINNGGTVNGSVVGGVQTPRIRIVRMNRPHHHLHKLAAAAQHGIVIGQTGNATFGFSIRGGREFGTGFFVSRVEKGSEAELQGLRVGDQIIRVNGYHVDDAVHKELSQFIVNQDRLTLKVRGVGMIPVKEHNSDSLSWHLVPLLARTSPPLNGLDDGTVCRDVCIKLCVAPRTKLGLGICKGPEWKPGIFVQFTKESGIARDAGLRPGDQILSCNGIDFSDVLFSEAVAVMKSVHILELVIRTGAGIDLFPGESSGYNSSASSVTGDQSPCWGDQSAKRLSIVREENYDVNLNKQQLQQQYQQQNQHISAGNWERCIDFISDKPYKDIKKLHPVDPPRVPINYLQTKDSNIDSNNNNNNNHNNNINKIMPSKPNANTTIIKLSDNGTVINNTLIPNLNNNNKVGKTTTVHLDNSNSDINNVTINDNYNSNNNNVNINKQRQLDDAKKIADICFVSRQSETKTVIVEVHRSNNNNSNLSNNNNNINNSLNDVNICDNIPPPPPPAAFSDDNRSPSVLSTSSTSLTSSSLMSGDFSCGTPNSSLSSAISDELKRRAEQRTKETNPLSEIEQKIQQTKLAKKVQGSNPLGGKNDERHNALMDEFKRAHRKMFKNGFTENCVNQQNDGNCLEKSPDYTDEERRQSELRKTAIETTGNCVKSHVTSNPSVISEVDIVDNKIKFSQNLNQKLQNFTNGTNGHAIASGNTLSNTNGNSVFSQVSTNVEFLKPKQQTNLSNGKIKPNIAPPPPPPPPMPKVINGATSTINGGGSPINGVKTLNGDGLAEKNESLPPMTPQPDYDTTPLNTMQRKLVLNDIQQYKQQQQHDKQPKGTMGRCAANEIARANGELAELESIESYKLTNPSSPTPKPPSAYFVPQNTGPATMKKIQKSVSVTIGEYGSATNRKEPSKFDFIQRANEEKNNKNDNDVSERLKNELEKTLSRSNLKKINDTTNLNGEQNGLKQQNKTTKLINNNNSIIDLQQNKLTDNYDKQMYTSTNRVTIQIPSKLNKSTDKQSPLQQQQQHHHHQPPNGILKNSQNNINNIALNQQINNLLNNHNNNGHNLASNEHKNITFGNVTTVIGER